MKHTMKTGFIRELLATRGRFISIMLLMFLSTFTLVGLKLVGPDIRMMANEYLDTYKLADLSVISSYGLDEDDVQTLNNIENSIVEYGYFTDVTISGTSDAIRVYSKPESISSIELVEGKMPSKDGEIAVSNQMRDSYPLGSNIELKEKGSTSNKVLKTTEYKVVGYVNSLEILSTVDLGATNVGTGTLTGYSVVNNDSFDSDVYMIARIYDQTLRQDDAFLDDYLQAVSNSKKEVEALLENRPEERLETVTSDAEVEIAENLVKLKDGEQELDDAKAQLNDAKIELNDAELKLSDAKLELDNAKVELEEGQVEIDNGYKQLNEAKAKLDSSSQELVDSQAELDNAQVEIDNGYAELEEAQTEIDNGYTKINASQAELDQSKAELENGKSQYLAGIDELQANIDNINLALKDPSLTAVEVATYEATLDSLNTTLSATKTEYKQFIANTYNPAIAEIKAGQAELDSATSELVAAQTEIDNGRLKLAEGQVELNNGQAKLDSGQVEIDNGYAEVEANRQKLDLAQTELNQGKIELDNGLIEYQEGLAEYEEGLAEYEEGLAEFNQEEPEARQDIEDGYKEIEEAKADLEQLALPVYTVNTRSETATSGGYQVLSSLATSIDKVANVFPILLYAVAALVTFTTMTRYVEDDRINTGTLLSLGYTEKEIIQKYVLYGVISSSVGSILGIILGAILIPELLYTAFRGEFTTPDLVLTFDLQVAVIALVVSVLCAALPAFIVSSAEFKHSPASLLLPKPPSDGSKIFLERITPIWNRLSFSHKVTARNIFRYKKRMFMTIFGVSGSVALLFTGLAMQGSIGNINDLQFGQIINYDLITVVDDSEDNTEELADYMNSSVVSDYQNVYIENLSVTAGDNDERQSITLTVGNDFTNYVDFRTRKDKLELNLDDGFVIINERLAEILELEVGDQFTVNSSENIPANLTVGGITEMYMGHFMYATPSTYEQAFGKEAKLNSYLVKLEDTNARAVTEQATNILKLDGVLTVMQNETLKNQVAGMSNSLNSVMSLIIVLSGLLAIVILYNITNINVNERMRELSTTKVLGYYDNEVTMYIYRETIILSLIGILVGYGFGRLIHLFMMMAVSPLNMMFDQNVVIIAFVAPAILIILISIVLGVIVHRRLIHVDMLEALKSVE